MNQCRKKHTEALLQQYIGALHKYESSPEDEDVTGPCLPYKYPLTEHSPANSEQLISRDLTHPLHPAEPHNATAANGIESL